MAEQISPLNRTYRWATIDTHRNVIVPQILTNNSPWTLQVPHQCLSAHTALLKQFVIRTFVIIWIAPDFLARKIKWNYLSIFLVQISFNCVYRMQKNKSMPQSPVINSLIIFFSLSHNKKHRPRRYLFSNLVYKENQKKLTSFQSSRSHL